MEDEGEAEEEEGVGETVAGEASTPRRSARLAGPSPALPERAELEAALAVVARAFLAMVYRDR